VVGWDGSAGAQAAFAAARHLFAERDLVVAAVGDDHGGTPPPAGDRVTAVHVPASGGSAATAEALNIAGAQHNAAAVVVGSRGRSAVRQMLLGSVAKAILHSAYRPVLVVPSP
jgi:nucleotide-binding universal stress UspA family protein